MRKSREYRWENRLVWWMVFRLILVPTDYLGSFMFCLQIGTRLAQRGSDDVKINAVVKICVNYVECTPYQSSFFVNLHAIIT